MQHFLDTATNFFHGTDTWVWFAALGSILLGFMVQKIAILFLNRLLKLTSKTAFQLDDIIIGALSKPISWAIVLGGIYGAVLILPIPKDPPDIQNFFDSLIGGMWMVIAVWAIIRLTDGFSDFFEQLMGGGAAAGPRGGAGPRSAGPRARTRAQAPPQRGANLRHELEIPLQTAVLGGKTEFYLNDEKIAVSIPAGVETGTKIRLRERGQPSPNGGPQGDLILLIKVSDHPHFVRKGKNLELVLPITLAEAALGAKVDVPTPSAEVSLSIPAGSSSGRRLRLKGQGVRQPDGTAGDLMVVLQIELPKSIDDESKTLIEQFTERNPMSVRQGLSF